MAESDAPARVGHGQGHTATAAGAQAVAFERGYYWTVSEAKIFKEGSMVLAGSNDLTPMLLSKSTPPPLGTDKNEPPKGTQNKSDILTQFI